MARLPQPGGDAGQWGEVLNQFLLVAHIGSGALKNSSVTESKLSSAVQTKLNAPTVVQAVAKTSNYNAKNGDFVISNASSSGFTVTLPAPTNGATVSVKKVDSSVNAIIVMRSGVLIDGNISAVVNNQWQSQDFFSDGLQWYRV